MALLSGVAGILTVISSAMCCTVLSCGLYPSVSDLSVTIYPFANEHVSLIFRQRYAKQTETTVIGLSWLSEGPHRKLNVFVQRDSSQQLTAQPSAEGKLFDWL